jgi:undecaprenyl-diphosphatase
MSLLQALVIAILQGASELFPVSSLGHAVILPGLLGWSLDQKAPEFLPFLVVLHLGTATALLAYFWRDWFGFAKAVMGRGEPTTVARERKVFWLIVVATLPAVVLGFGLEHRLCGLFGIPALAAGFLIVNGFILFVGDRMKHAGAKTLDQVGFKTAFIIGACQALALIPGISRSGATMVGGVLAGLTHKESARFSFLMATPIIAGASVLEVPKLLKIHNQIAFNDSVVLTAGLVAGVVAYLSVALLMHYFKKNEIDSLKPFAFYCWVAGTISLFMLF